MAHDNSDRLDDIYERARELDGAARDAFLDGACAGDAQLRTAAERLLAQDIDGFLEQAGVRVGPFRLVRELGRGGMGVVHLAEQEHGIRRTVALKLVQRGMLTPEALARFESEKQALALMNHSSIAKVFDAGATDAGAPYFAMEYVDGLPIVEHCDRERLPIAARLALFADVCAGVQHAHQRGVLHRDLKSSNVLVARGEGRAVPKIIDFGIAKALGPPLVAGGPETHVGQVVGTLDCMAPEQLDWSQHDVDTRADVYGLGVLLYELLAGSRPFDVTALRQVGLVEAVRILREQDAAPPSVRLAAAGPRLAALAQARAIDPRGLCRRVRGDLDWITLRALAKDRERRYASAAELAADIARHLANEPVSARAPSLAYRGGRFVKRHKAGVAAGAIVLVALVGGTAAATIGLVRARRAEQRARVEARTAGEVTKYLVNTFRLAEPEQARGAAVTAREILDAQERTIRGALAGDPGVQGRVMRAMGEAYGGLGLYDRALALLEEAVPRIEAAYGPGSEFLYDALNEFGNVANQAGDHAAARRAFERALAAATQALGDKHPNRALILGNLGSACLELGDLNAARQHLETALALNQENHGKASGAVARTLASLAQLEIRAGRPGEAVALAERSLEIRRQRFAPGEPALGHGHFMLGEALLAANRRAEAAVQYAAALPIWESAYGTSHALVGECLFGLAQARAGGGATPAERAVAYALYLRARTIVEAAFPKENPRLAAQRASWFERYVPFLFAVGREAEARQTAEAAAALRAAGKQAGATE